MEFTVLRDSSIPELIKEYSLKHILWSIIQGISLNYGVFLKSY